MTRLKLLLGVTLLLHHVTAAFAFHPSYFSAKLALPLKLNVSIFSPFSKAVK